MPAAVRSISPAYSAVDTHFEMRIPTYPTRRRLNRPLRTGSPLRPFGPASRRGLSDLASSSPRRPITQLRRAPVAQPLLVFLAVHLFLPFAGVNRTRLRARIGSSVDRDRVKPITHLAISALRRPVPIASATAGTRRSRCCFMNGRTHGAACSPGPSLRPPKSRGSASRRSCRHAVLFSAGELTARELKAHGHRLQPLRAGRHLHHHVR